jgi:hypothetical protein
MPQLSPLAKKALQRAKSDHGIAFDPVDDFEDILELHTLAEAVTNPTLTEDELSIITPHAYAGSLKICKPTIGAIHWYNTYAAKWFADDVEASTLSLAYAIALGRHPDKMMELGDKGKARKAVFAWSAGLDCTYDELAAALATLSSESPEEREDDDARSYGPIISLLVSEYGQTPDYWLWETSYDVCEALIKDYKVRKDAEAQAAGGASGSGHAMDPHLESVRANGLLMKAITRMIEARK